MMVVGGCLTDSSSCDEGAEFEPAAVFLVGEAQALPNKSMVRTRNRERELTIVEIERMEL